MKYSRESDIGVVLLVVMVLAACGVIMWSSAQPLPSDGLKYALKCEGVHGPMVQEIVIGLPVHLGDGLWEYTVAHDEAPRYFVGQACTLRVWGKGGRDE